MNKVFLLMKLLHKTEGKRIGNTGASLEFLPQIILIVLGSAAFGFFGWNYPILEISFGAPADMCLVLTLTGALVGVVLTFPQLLNMMFFSADSAIFLTMPLTMPQILAAKMFSASDWIVSILFICTIPFTITSGITCGMGAEYYISGVLAFITAPIVAMTLLASVLMLVMFLVKGLRKNDTTKVLGALLAFAAIVVYMLFVNGNSDIVKRLASVTKGVKKVNAVLPVNIFLRMLMKGNVLIGIAGTLAVTAVCLLLFILLAKTIYLSTALSIGESSGKSKSFNDAELKKATASSSVLRAYLRKEFLMVRREPAYLLPGFLLPLAYPVLVIFILAFSGKAMDQFGFATAQNEVSILLRCLMMTNVITTLATTTSAIASTSISREGEEILFIKQTPVPHKTVLRAKLLLAVLVSAVGSTTYVLVGGIVFVILGDIPFWCVPAALLMNIGFLLFFVSIDVLLDVCKPMFSWDSLAVLIKKKTGFINVILLLVGMIFPMLLGFIVDLGFPELRLLVSVIWILVALILGIVMTAVVYKVGCKKMSRY